MSLRSYALSTAFLTSSLLAQTPDTFRGASFHPDGKFTGSSLSGFHTLGGAQWSIANGEITAKGGSTGGWLISDNYLQDTAVYTAFKCVGACDAGIAFRLQKTSDGMKGNFLSLKADKIAGSDITIDPSGKLTSETAENRTSVTTHVAPPPTPSNNGRPYTPPILVGPQPLRRPAPGIYADKWNEIEASVDENVLRGFLNDTAETLSTNTGDVNGYGPFALYVGPNSEIHFKGVVYRDYAYKDMPAEQVGKGFRKQQISPFYLGWSADAADFNHDGKMDVLAGPNIYFGPEYTRRREIFPGETASPGTQYITELFHAFDFTKDGWPDVLSTNLGDGGVKGIFLYVNPKNESRRWTKYKIADAVSSEESVLRDIDGDGTPEIIYFADGFMCFAKADTSDATKPWTVHHVSEKGSWAQHGVGLGDINGDGKPDILGTFGWWEQPKAISNEPWKYHEVGFGRYGRSYVGGAQLGAIDVNGDGLMDVVCTLDGHGWGLAWFEQKRSASGEISFVQHIVMDNFNTGKNADIAFSEIHGADIADIDGDGVPDYIVGKRVYAHLDDYSDPDPYSGAFLYWFKAVRDPKLPGGGDLVPHLIHNWSGAGAEVRAVDIDGDGKPEVLVSTKLGSFIFWNQMGTATKKPTK